MEKCNYGTNEEEVSKHSQESYGEKETKLMWQGKEIEQGEK